MVDIDALVWSDNLKWIIRGNIVVPTGNPFKKSVQEEHENEESIAEQHPNVTWLGHGLKLLHDHVLTVEGSGVIRHLLPYPSFMSDFHIKDIDWTNDKKFITLHSEYDFVCPGMIDLHIHAPQYAYTGTATDKPLMGKDGWLETYTFPAERRLRNDLSYAENVYSKVVQSTLRNGTTTAVYFATLDLEPCKVLVDCAIQYGQRAIIGKVCMDRNSPSDYCQTLEQNIQETEELIQYIYKTQSKGCTALFQVPPLVSPVVIPRFIPTCTPALLTELGNIAAKYDCHITSHISESVDEVEFTQFLERDCDNIDGKIRRTDAMIFDSHKLLSNKCIMAHGVHVSDADCDLLKQRNTAIAHCPLSNFFFAGGILPCRKLMERENRIGIGTDVAGGYNCSMLHSARMTVVASQALQQQQIAQQLIDTRTNGSDTCSSILDYRHAFYLATLGGAEALYMHDRIGTLKVGMEFDAIILSADVPHSPVQIFDSDSTSDIFQKLVVLGDDRNIRRVFVQGQDVTV
jgi:guanine deaminase